MKLFRQSVFHSAAFALSLTAVAVLTAVMVRPFLGANLFLPFLAAVWICAWRHGRTGGLFATGASGLAVFYFFVWPDLESASTPSWSALAQLITFALMGSLMTWLTASWRETRDVLRSTLASIGDALIATDSDGRVTFMNSIAETLTGWPVRESRGRPSDEVLRLVNSKTHEAIANPISRAIRDRVLLTAEFPVALVSRSGAEVPVEHTAAPVRDHAGEVRGGILVFRDVSSRLQLEEQATHAHKMDAVGRLAGGVAGDFNNVLTVIAGNAELLRNEAAAASPARRYADEILYAGERAAALTRHLLAFSRGATAQPRMIDLNAVITAIEPMLRRLLGQEIELMALKGPGLGRVKADPSQIEQAVLTLAANSRDAMPGGGKLVIETANVELEEGGGKNAGVRPGSYVMLAVSDTGAGMDAETRSRLFEPFFTTKASSKGGGLGLAAVYGAIKQMDGQVTVYSQPQCGTIFEIYLPRAKEAAPAVERRRSAKGSETILVVDDEEGVRKVVHAVLSSNGYTVLETSSGAAALAAFEKNGHKIDMALTDVVMPQMSGFELGKQLEERAPSLKILYMSGYRENAMGGASGQAPKAFLHKPFTPDALLSKVREVLDAGTA